MALKRILWVTCVVFLTAAACGDSPTGPGSGLRIANLQATQLGLNHALCETSFSYSVHDELTFDILGAGNTNLIGATLHGVLDDGTETLVGSVTECTQDATSCQSPNRPPMNVCLIGSGSVKRIRALARVPWTPVRNWRAFLRVDGTNTNVAQTQISRPDGLPMGNTAAIAYIELHRSSPNTGGFALNAYSPGIAGRRITLIREIWANGVRLTVTDHDILENQAGPVGIQGGVPVSPGPTELIGMLEERDAGGNVIATDRKTASIP